MNQDDKVVFADGFPLVNIGCGKDLTIKELADTIKEVIGYEGEWQWDTRSS